MSLMPDDVKDPAPVQASSVRDIPLVSRHHFVTTSVLALGATFIVYLPQFPFDKRLGAVSFISFLVHAFASIFFRYIRRQVHHVLLLVDVLLLAVAIHFTGGVMSPFVVVFGCILVSGVYSGVEHPLILPAVLMAYGSMVAVEFFGIVKPIPVTAAQIYASPATTLLVFLAVLFHLALTGYFYDMVMKNLRIQVNEEQLQKQHLIKKMTELEASSQVGVIAAKIAHDIHGPLTAISGFLQLMKEDNQLNPVTAEDCEIMIGETERISKMTEKMLRFVRPDPASKGALCPVQLIDNLLTVIQFHPKSAGVSFQRDFSVSGNLRVLGHKESLQQVYFNIIKNALEAMPVNSKKKVVNIIIREDAANCSISISDTGLGMSNETRERVLRGFHSTKESGLGLGLVIVREILSQYGGAFDIVSVPSQGTVVTTQLPIYKETSSPSA
jgi:signal transduction histidine kinase